jgi:hypothetical protein
MGFLAELGLENVDEDPNAFPDSTYNAYVTDAKIVKVNDQKEDRLVLTYTLADGEHKGKQIDEFKNCDKTANARDLAWLKSRLKSLGVPEEKLSSINLDDLKGIAIRITTKKKGQYRNVTNVVLGHAGGGVTASATSALDAPATPVGTGADVLL